METVVIGLSFIFISLLIVFLISFGIFAIKNKIPFK